MGSVNPQAVELNDTIMSVNPQVMAVLSQRGKEIFFPKKGILGQSAEAKGKEINATIGIALEDDGSPLRLECIERLINLDPADIFPYAPSYGRPDIRETWRKMIYTKNPGLTGTDISNPVVTSALTHGLSMCGYLFAEVGDRVVTPDLYWGNYRLIFSNAYGAEMVTFPTFTGGGFNVNGLRDTIFATPPGKCLVSLNFPNNPTGYTPTEAEADAIRQVLVDACHRGYRIVALIDDAYFGLVYEENIMTESIFTRLAGAHDSLLAVKIDGATKEDYVWGFRVGFLTFAVQSGTPALYRALEAKAAGAIRGNISNCSNLSQSALNAAFRSVEYEQQKQQKYATLKARYVKVRQILSAHPEYADYFIPLPFNSGYFMCLEAKKGNAEAIRQKLLSDFSTGIIVANGVMRLAFSATPMRLLEKLFDNLYQAAQQVAS